jgi:hypothetical protein
MQERQQSSSACKLHSESSQLEFLLATLAKFLMISSFPQMIIVHLMAMNDWMAANNDREGR